MALVRDLSWDEIVNRFTDDLGDVRVKDPYDSRSNTYIGNLNRSAMFDIVRAFKNKFGVDLYKDLADAANIKNGRITSLKTNELEKFIEALIKAPTLKKVSEAKQFKDKDDYRARHWNELAAGKVADYKHYGELLNKVRQYNQTNKDQFDYENAYSYALVLAGKNDLSLDEKLTRLEKLINKQIDKYENKKEVNNQSDTKPNIKDIENIVNPFTEDELWDILGMEEV
jgi:hypothetical protein